MIKELLAQLETSENPVVKLLHKGDTSKVLVIVFKKGMILKEHKTNLPAKLIIIKGNVIYREENKEIALQELQEMVIPVGVIHSVEALEYSLCLLIQG